MGEQPDSPTWAQLGSVFPSGNVVTPHFENTCSCQGLREIDAVDKLHGLTTVKVQSRTLSCDAARRCRATLLGDCSGSDRGALVSKGWGSFVSAMPRADDRAREQAAWVGPSRQPRPAKAWGCPSRLEEVSRTVALPPGHG
jgi:hypothetical protein